MTSKPLYDHQTRSITLLRQALRAGSKRPALQLPTGAGKTRVAAEIINMARAKGNRVIFTVPAISLIDQTARSFGEEGIRDVGILQADHPGTNPAMPVQIASIQTLARRQIPPAQLVIIDEAHRMSEFVTDWMGRDEWSKVPFIGLTATPWAKGMGRLYDRLIIGSTTQELIDGGFLSPFRVFAPSHPDLEGVKTVAGYYHEGQLSEAMQKGTLTADIVKTWLERGENRPTLCFAVDRAHAAAIQKEFQRAGVLCGYVDAYTELDEREEIRKQFASGELEVVCNVGVLTTGVDWDVRCIILARPTKSEILFVQIVGRGLRTADGKSDCLILDHSDTTLRLGFVTDIQHHQLHGGNMAENNSSPQEKPPAVPKECPKCHALKAAGVRKCPECGFEPSRQSEIEVVEGELIELDSRRAKKSNREYDWDDKVRFISELRGLAHVKGHSDGWVAHKYRTKFGVWPNDPRVKYVAPKAPSFDTMNWIKSQNIRWAKSKERSA